MAPDKKKGIGKCLSPQSNQMKSLTSNTKIKNGDRGGISTRLPQHCLWGRSEREKIHDDKGNMLSVRKGKIKLGHIYLSCWFIQLTTPTPIILILGLFKEKNEHASKPSEHLASSISQAAGGR